MWFPEMLQWLKRSIKCTQSNPNVVEIDGIHDKITFYDKILSPEMHRQNLTLKFYR
jgi:hypothetical protein